jgi:hypothetical protein
MGCYFNPGDKKYCRIINTRSKGCSIMTYREDEAREILRRVNMAYGVDKYPDPPEYYEKPEPEYDENLTDRFEDEEDE